jgi:hypothetical protein
MAIQAVDGSLQSWLYDMGYDQQAKELKYIGQSLLRREQ